MTRIGVSGAVLAAVLAAGAGASAQDMSCEGKRFVFFPGGAEGDPFATIVYNGAVLAAEHTGCQVDHVWSGWNPEQMVRQFSEAIARRPDGIALMGHPGEAALRPLIDQAREAGIIVTTQNVDLPDAEEEYKASGFGYVGAQNYTAGENLARGAISECGLGEDDRAFVWGLLGQEARGLRTQGVIDALEEAGIEVEYLEISDQVNRDAPTGIPVFSSVMAANPDITVVVTDHGALTATLPAYLQAAGREPGSVCAAGFDLTAATVQGIKDEYVTIVLDQQPFLQGYLPIVQLFLASTGGFAGMNIDTGAALITKENAEEVEALAAAAIR